VKKTNNDKNIMKNLCTSVRRFRDEAEKGQDLLQLAVWMAVVAIILGVGALALNIYIKNANGNACTRQLAEIHRGTMSLVAVRNITTDTDYSSAATEANIKPYVGNKTFVGTSGDMKCPSGGTYAIGTWNATTTAPDKPTCTLGQSGADATDNQAAKFHYLGPN
jgi:hypothetical protein